MAVGEFMSSGRCRHNDFLLNKSFKSNRLARRYAACHLFDIIDSSRNSALSISPVQTKKIFSKKPLCGVLLVSAAHSFAATPNLQGQSGYINMPNAAVEADGTFSLGYGYDSPYGALWVSSTVLPMLQVTGRYVSITGTPQFAHVTDAYWRNYGRYKDKVVDAKLNLWNETSSLPAVSIGATDLQGTGLFKGGYVVATKTFGVNKSFEASIGYGARRPDGIFGGVRWSPVSAPRWALIAEYDSTDYKKDFEAASTGAAKHPKGMAAGVEYRWGWLGAKITRQRDRFGANAYISIPFYEREFVPKVFEPAPMQRKDGPAPSTVEQWRDEPSHGAALVNALTKQDFKNVRVQFEDKELRLSLTNNRISNTGRAIGRAARTALLFAPQGTRTLQITYTQLEQPVATYEFHDLERLSDYISGLIDRESFLQTVLVRYAIPSDRAREDRAALLSEVPNEGALEIQAGRDGNIVQIASEDRESGRFKTIPKLGFFFNDPSGALRYELAAASVYDKRLSEGFYLNSALKLNILENITGVTQTSNSLLPHVRTDIAEYKRGGRLKLNRLLLNKYINPEERVYARLSAGLYEEMFRGIGGQILYLPKDSRWAVDMSVDALQQRGYRGWFDKKDYSVVTGLASLHYRLPYDITVTGRAGRFLAKDNGVRFEFKRTFSSGVEIGAWYAKTNGRDITNPGSPANPYNDKGVFLSVPLNIMLPFDSQASAGMSLSPWTRDVGQMVGTPGDLYDMLEKPRRDMTTYDGLGNFAERADEQNLPAVNPPVRPMPNMWNLFRWRVEQSVSHTPTLPQWAEGTAVAGASVAAAALLDRPVDRFMKRHGGNGALRTWGNVGKALPVALTGGAAAAFALGDSRMQNIGMISLESVATAAAMSVMLKHLVGRARPDEESGAWSRSAQRSNASFPSNHSTVSFAAVTPFAQEYDAPWLYGLAGVGSLGRTASRQHWVSDVVAGGALGYAVGTWLWKSQRAGSQSNVSLTTGGNKEVGVVWAGRY